MPANGVPEFALQWMQMYSIMLMSLYYKKNKIKKVRLKQKQFFFIIIILLVAFRIFVFNLFLFTYLFIFLQIVIICFSHTGEELISIPLSLKGILFGML